MKIYESLRLVECKDANHHGTLFAASCAAWVVEMGFTTAACVYPDTKGLVCRGMDKLTFNNPIEIGSVVRLTGELIKAGTTSLTVRVRVYPVESEAVAVEATITFVTIDPKSRQKIPHGVKI